MSRDALAQVVWWSRGTRRRVADLPPDPYEDVDRTVRVVRVKMLAA
jgi:hypothetical protein